MPYRESPSPRGQVTLWSERLDDAIPADHQVRHVLALFESEVFGTAFADLDRRCYQCDGAPSYPPSLLAKLYVYGQLVHIRSSRRLEAACHDRFDVVWLMEAMKPDHTTISRFVTAHGDWLSTLLKTTIQAGMDVELVTLDSVAIDGTFIEANASRRSVKDQAKIKEEIDELDGVVARLQQAFQEADEIEGRLAEADMLASPDTSLPMEERLRRSEAKRARLLAAAAKIDLRAAMPQRPGSKPPKPIASTTDPDARHMKDKEGRVKPNYNVQVAVDCDSGFIVGADVTDAPNDVDQMDPMLDAVEENCGKPPQNALFDAGYHTPRQVASALDRSTRVYVTDRDLREYRKASESRAILEGGGSLSLAQIEALPMTKNKFSKTCFVYDEEHDVYRCPAGQTMTPQIRRTQRDKHGPIETVEYRSVACATCSLGTKCYTSKHGRIMTRREFDSERHRMLCRTIGDEGKSMALRRASTVEPRIGEMKTIGALRKFSRRGLRKVRFEVFLAAIAMNIKRLLRIPAAQFG